MLPPACKVSLIRNDLSTIWCELTASIRTKAEPIAVPPSSPVKQGGKPKKEGSNSNSESNEESTSSSESEQQTEKELLLCFRPFREGEKVGEELRFCPKAGEDTDGSSSILASSVDATKVSSMDSTNVSSMTSPSSKASSSKKASKKAAATPASAKSLSEKKQSSKKKRHLEVEEKMSRSDDNETQVDANEKSAIETMMKLANHK